MIIAIAVVCTNAYFILGIRFVKQFMHFYKGKYDIEFYLFTDTDSKPYAPNMTNIHYIHTVHTSWVDATNSKFSNIIKLQSEPCDYIYFFDADTSISKPFTETWFLGNLVGGEHYNNRWLDKNGKPLNKGYDRNPKSKAYIPLNTPLPQMYYYGAFFGGIKQSVLDFCKTLINNQIEDRKIPYEPIWNDESYINNYFHYNPPSFVVKKDAFAFNISDKGDIDNTRNPARNIEALKQSILQNPTQLFNIKKNKISFRNKVQIITNYKSIDLSKIQTIILHTQIASRKDHIHNVLKNSNLQFTLFNCIVDTDRSRSEIRSIIQICSDLLARLSFEPILFLQDNINITEAFANIIKIPNDSDCVYLGLSKCCSGPSYSPTVPWIDIQGDTLVKITDMLSTHAFLVTSEKWLHELLKTMQDTLDKSINYDIPIAHKMKDYNIYGFKKPMFYQDATVGGQQGPTKITFSDIEDKVLF
jgi:hypothetical protein